MLFLLALKWNLYEKAFFTVKAKLAVKIAEISYCSFLSAMKMKCIKISWSCKHMMKMECIEINWSCKHMKMECIEINWSCKHMKKVRSRESSISIYRCIELSKTQFSMWVSFILELRFGNKPYKNLIEFTK